MSYTANQIKAQLGISHNISHKRFTKKMWRAWVRLGHTELGYHDWMATQVTAELVEGEVE